MIAETTCSNLRDRVMVNADASVVVVQLFLVCDNPIFLCNIIILCDSHHDKITNNN